MIPSPESVFHPLLGFNLHAEWAQMASKSLASDVTVRTKIHLGELLRSRVCEELVEFIICNKFSDSYQSQFSSTVRLQSSEWA